jgi:hypothetical protein
MINSPFFAQYFGASKSVQLYRVSDFYENLFSPYEQHGTSCRQVPLYSANPTRNLRCDRIRGDVFLSSTAI